MGSLLSTSNDLIAQGIDLPPPPAAAPPPSIPRVKDPVEARQAQKEEKHESEVIQQQEKRELERVKSEEKKAQEEAKKPRPLYGFIELSLLQPKASVSNGRSHYVCDPTTHVNTYIRTAWSKEASSIQPWVGLRIAPFGGYGTQERLTARFAHTWMGPAIGLGAIGPPESPDDEKPTRLGFIWSLGIAAVSRLSDPEDNAGTSPSDFQPTAWSADNPGLWSEIRIFQIRRGAVGVGLLGGVQLGTGKTFVYAGLSASGFN